MKKIYYFFCLVILTFGIISCDKHSEFAELEPAPDTETPGNDANDGTDSSGNTGSDDYNIWNSVSFQVAPGVKFAGRYHIVPKKEGRHYYFRTTRKDFYVVLTQDVKTVPGKRIYEVATAEKVPVDAYFPQGCKDTVAISDMKATVIFVDGSIKDSQTIVLKY